MTNDAAFLYMQSTQREFEWLCGQIVCDGRDPHIVACALTEQVSRRLRELKSLWDGRLTASASGQPRLARKETNE